MGQSVEFVTTDGGKYALRIWSTQGTSTLPAGQSIRPTLSITQDPILIGASTNAWEPSLTNQQRPIIPLYLSMYAYQQTFNPRTVFRFSTPYLIQQSGKFGENKWPVLIAPYCQTISDQVSTWPATTDLTTVAFNGNIILKEYERIAFSNADFMNIVSPIGSQKFIQFFPTYNISAYAIQQQQPPFPLTGTALNDFVNTINIGYQPGWVGDVPVTVSTIFMYFELVSKQ